MLRGMTGMAGHAVTVGVWSMLHYVCCRFIRRLMTFQASIAAVGMEKRGELRGVWRVALIALADLNRQVDMFFGGPVVCIIMTLGAEIKAIGSCQ